MPKNKVKKNQIVKPNKKQVEKETKPKPIYTVHVPCSNKHNKHAKTMSVVAVSNKVSCPYYVSYL